MISGNIVKYIEIWKYCPIGPNLQGDDIVRVKIFINFKYGTISRDMERYSEVHIGMVT